MNKVKLKMKHARLFGFCSVLAQSLEYGIGGLDFNKKLAYIILRKLYQKLRNKMEDGHKKEYTYTLTDQEALALFVFYGIPNEVISFRGSIMHEVNSKVHQKYA